MYFGYGRVNAHQALLYDTLSSGIGAENNPSQLMVFPNPATSELNIYLSQAPDEVFVAEIYSVSGQRVHNKTFVNSKNKLVLDVEQLPAGMYIISIKGEEFIKTEKFLKQ